MNAFICSGDTIYFSSAAEDDSLVRTEPCWLYTVVLTNTGAADLYGLICNRITAPANGTLAANAVVAVLMAPGGTTSIYQMAGLPLGIGCGIALSSTATSVTLGGDVGLVTAVTRKLN